MEPGNKLYSNPIPEICYKLSPVVRNENQPIPQGQMVTGIGLPIRPDQVVPEGLSGAVRRSSR